MSKRQHTNILRAVSFSVSGIQVLQKRPDFLRAARGQRHHSKTIMVQKFDRRDGAGIRVGFTCSKKVGNAVLRNRAKRRLRAAAQMMLAQHGEMGCDYILIGKHDTTANLPFDRLQSDLKYCLTQLANEGAK
jgi:ribonuclease P protein component